MGLLDSVWRSTLDIVKDSAARVGVHALRLQLDTARRALREGDAEQALELTDFVIGVGEAMPNAESVRPFVGAAYGVAARGAPPKALRRRLARWPPRPLSCWSEQTNRQSSRVPS